MGIRIGEKMRPKCEYQEEDDGANRAISYRHLLRGDVSSPTAGAQHSNRRHDF